MCKDHQRFSGANESHIVFSHMKIYFSHLFLGVNQRYQNSMMNDPTLRLTIKLTNFLFLIVCFYSILNFDDLQILKFCLIIQETKDSEWTNSSLVGDEHFMSFEGKDVIVTDRSLKYFASYMNSKNFSFQYDHAIGLFK